MTEKFHLRAVVFSIAGVSALSLLAQLATLANRGSIGRPGGLLVQGACILLAILLWRGSEKARYLLIVLSIFALVVHIFILFVLLREPAEADTELLFFTSIPLLLEIYWFWALTFSMKLRNALSVQRSYYAEKSQQQKNAFHEALGEKFEE